MEQLLSRPEIQSAVAPFAIALLAYLGLRKFTAMAWIWALFAAFVVSAVLINGVIVTPLTGTRKIIMLIIAALMAAALLPRILPDRNLQRGAVAALCLLALAWVFWAVVARMPPGAIALFVAGCVALVACLTLSFDRLAHDPAQLQGAGLGLLIGVGLSATAAASALLGQLALALAAGSGGTLLAWVLTGSLRDSGSAGKTMTILPYVLAPATLGVAAVIFARLPWYALIPLAAIPFTVSQVPLKSESRFLRALLASLPGLVIAVAVALWIWQSSGSDSGY
jgi:hypothetical protein